MRRIEYTLNQNGDPFCIASCDIRGSWNTLNDCPAIEMSVAECRDNCNKTSDILTTVRLNDASEELASAFRAHHTEFLKGQYGDWKLVQIQCEAGKVQLEYYSAVADDIDSITLGINDNSAGNLNLKFQVPHQDQRPNTEYIVLMDYRERASSTIIEEHLPSKRSVFLFMSNEPDKISVTEYVDL